VDGTENKRKEEEKCLKNTSWGQGTGWLGWSMEEMKANGGENGEGEREMDE